MWFSGLSFEVVWFGGGVFEKHDASFSVVWGCCLKQFYPGVWW